MLLRSPRDHAHIARSDPSSRGSRLPLRLLPTFGAVEHHPHDKVVSEVLEAVLDAGRHEERVAGPEGVTLRSVDERAAPADHEVQLVPRVRFLRVPPARGVDLDLYGAVAHHLRKPLAVRPRQLLHRLPDRRPSAARITGLPSHRAPSRDLRSLRFRLARTSGHSLSMML